MTICALYCSTTYSNSWIHLCLRLCTEISSDSILREVYIKLLRFIPIKLQLNKLIVYYPALVVKYTRSSCQSSTLCHNNLEDNNHVFSVGLNTSEHPHNEYLCLPDDELFIVHGCSVATENYTEGMKVLTMIFLLKFNRFRFWSWTMFCCCKLMICCLFFILTLGLKGVFVVQPNLSFISLVCLMYSIS